MMDSSGKPVTLGEHLANRLVQCGLTHYFGVPGDFNLVLLDQLLKNKDLKPVWCCNELNAGYAADGCARATGVPACLVVTFCVGGLSAINAVAGAYSEDLPLIVISGGPNSNDFAANHLLHHTTGLTNFDQQMQAYKEFTCAQVKICFLERAHAQIDYALAEAMRRKKPVYIEISCNIASLSHPSFSNTPVPYSIQPVHTNPASLKAAVAAAAAKLAAATKPVLIAGVRIRHSAKAAMLKLANASQYPVAVTADAKGMFPESYPRFISTYWGAVSSPVTCEIVESADIVLTAGAVWTDYSTTGYSLLLDDSRVIKVEPDRVTICGGQTFGCIHMADFLEALADAVQPNDAAYVIYKRMYLPLAQPEEQAPSEPLQTKVLFKHIQSVLTPTTAIVAEVGDSWFNSQKLSLPEGCSYELQMRYGSIGWSVGAALGYAAAVAPERRVLALIGDGSFQMTAQEVSTMLRYELNPVIVLINNSGYTIEVEIHDGPYNNIKNWNYTAFVEALQNGEGKLFTAKARTEPELVDALRAAYDEHRDSLCFIEVVVDRHDCSKELLEWGSRVAAANSRKPNPQ